MKRKRNRPASAETIARRRWGRVRILLGGRALPERRTRPRVPRGPGTVAERRLVARILGRQPVGAELVDAIKLLRAGVKLKEREITERLDALLRPET